MFANVSSAYHPVTLAGSSQAEISSLKALPSGQLRSRGRSFSQTKNLEQSPPGALYSRWPAGNPSTGEYVTGQLNPRKPEHSGQQISLHWPDTTAGFLIGGCRSTLRQIRQKHINGYKFVKIQPLHVCNGLLPHYLSPVILLRERLSLPTV